KGLANSSGLLGKYMMAHFSSGTWALFDEDIQSYMGTTGAQLMSYERYAKTSQKGAFGSSFIVTGSALKTSGLGGFANARLDLFGPDLYAFMKRAARGLTRINAFGEELPNVENRIELVSDKDEFGMPLAKIINSYGQTHEIANLYVAGPGIFATGGASNPTYTIFALSLRSAEQLAAKWKAIAA